MGRDSDGRTILAMVGVILGAMVACTRAASPGSTARNDGATAQGGAPSQDGAVATGGLALGGTSGSGGVHSAGGSASLGDASLGGDAPATGGVVTTGGASATGGTGPTGGRTATGGSSASGGTNAAGGSSATGGASAATGGAGPTGGTIATGGSHATGGAITTGGASATGGAIGTGGIGATGGNSALGGTTAPGAVSQSWDFAADGEGWVADFADYHPGPDPYNLESGWAELPSEVGPGSGLRISGVNLSDDLFMYLKRKLTGLAANTTYLLDVTAVLDTNASSDCIGGGGAPGTGVLLKIGALSVEPVPSLDSLGWLRMNLDKDSEDTLGTGGVDMKTVGDIGNTLPCIVGSAAAYQAKTLTLSGFSVDSAADGTLWLVLGTDSGFEGPTTLYYDRISINLQPRIGTR